MKLEVGKLYTCEKYHLLFYPDADTASAATAELSILAGDLPAAQRVSYAEKNIPLLVLNNKEKYIKVLAGDRKGWIIYRDWLKIREIV